MLYQYWRICERNKVSKFFSSVAMTLSDCRSIYFSADRVEPITESEFHQ